MKIFDWTKKIEEQEMFEVINALNEEKLVVFPTDTVYGIGGNALSLKAIDKLFQTKKRDYSKPISLLVADIDVIKSVAYVSQDEAKIIDAFMPGALTIILKKKDCINSLLTAGSDTVGVRIPNHDIALSILKSVNYPLATTSANISGEANIADFAEIVKVLNGHVDIFIKGNISSDLVASTVVKLDEGNINILREGDITLDDIKKLLVSHLQDL